jgi:hypothetical protein
MDSRKSPKGFLPEVDFTAWIDTAANKSGHPCCATRRIDEHSNQDNAARISRHSQRLLADCIDRRNDKAP